MALKLADLFARGAVFALHCGWWRARETLTAADLGIEDTADVRRALSLGTLRLAPPEALAPVLAFYHQACAALDSASLDFRMIPGARYVPEERMDALSESLSNARTAYGIAADALCSDALFATLRESQLDSIRGALTEALSQKRDYAQLVQRAVERVRANYPSATEARRRFYLRWNVYVLDSVDNALVDSLADTEAEVADVIGGMIAGLREEVREKLASVCALLRDGGKWTERTVNSARATFERVRALNILGDSALNKLLSECELLIRLVDPTNPNTVASSLSGLERAAEALAGDAAQATREAEAALTSYSRRKITPASRPQPMEVPADAL